MLVGGVPERVLGGGDDGAVGGFEVDQGVVVFPGMGDGAGAAFAGFGVGGQDLVAGFDVGDGFGGAVGHDHPGSGGNEHA